MMKVTLAVVALAALTAAASGRQLTQMNGMSSSMGGMSSPMNGGMSSSMNGGMSSSMNGGMSPSMNGGMSPMMSMGSMNKAPMAPMMGPMMMAPMMAPMGMKTVAATAMANPMLSTLVEALAATNLTGPLNDPSFKGTVFAPTNEAFTMLMMQMNMTKAQLLMAPTLKPILEYHVVPGMAAKSTDLYNKETLPTMLKGSSLYIGMMNGMPLIQGMMSNSTVAMPNMMADMAVVHVVNTVLLPSTKTLDMYKTAAPSS